MAGMVFGDGTPEYCGLASIFEYTNGDGELCGRNCGQAAAATLLTHHGLLEPIPARAVGQMHRLEQEHPPDNLGGVFGTSRKRVERICAAFGLPLREVAGEAALRGELDAGNPVVVMVGVPAGRVWGVDLPGGHWMVAYGYDAEAVYLTNYGRMEWAAFRRGWYSFVGRLIRMHGRGLAADRAAPERVA
jgi:hypothetical protein